MHCAADPSVVAWGMRLCPGKPLRQSESWNAPRQNFATSRSAFHDTPRSGVHAWRTCHSSDRHSLHHSLCWRPGTRSEAPRNTANWRTWRRDAGRTVIALPPPPPESASPAAGTAAGEAGSVGGGGSAMTVRPASLLHVLQLAVLRGASLLVPGRQHRDWWREWRSELWHVRHACTPLRGVSWNAEREVAKFCLGAFQDSLCLRGLPGQRRIPHATTLGSAAQCILWLVGLVATSYGVAQLLPGAALAHQYAHYRDARNLMLIRDARYTDVSVPTISAA